MRTAALVLLYVGLPVLGTYLTFCPTFDSNFASIQTERGNYVVRGNDVRFVLRTPGGSLLNSTYFTAETTSDGMGGIASLVVNGGGYGHGIGMCQFGAIGRARAGQDYRTILTTYYPGTTVSRVH